MIVCGAEKIIKPVESTGLSSDEALENEELDIREEETEESEEAEPVKAPAPKRGRKKKE